MPPLDDTARQAVRRGRRMGGSAIKCYRLVPPAASNLTDRLPVLKFTQILRFRRNVSAETELVSLQFGRSRNQAETVLYVRSVSAPQPKPKPNFGRSLVWRAYRNSLTRFQTVPSATPKEPFLEIGGLQLSYLLLSKEQVKLPTSNLGAIFTCSFRIKVH